MALLASTLIAFVCAGGTGSGPIESVVRQDRELERALSSMVDSRSAERSRGERWIAAHARSADFPALAEAAENGGAEVAVRLARALGSDERHLGLALLFADERKGSLARIGEDAVRDMLAHWSEGLGGDFRIDAIQDATFRQALERTRDTWPGERYRLALGGSVRDAVDRLVRLSGLTVPVVVDPMLREVRGPIRRPLVLEGTWDQILAQIANQSGASLVGPLAKDSSDEDVPVFVCLRPPSMLLANVRATLVDWCLLSAEEGPIAERAARALGEVGWPAALAWLEERWVERGDGRALEGLLVSAARGRVVPALQRADAVQSLLATADRAFAVGDVESLRLARAIARALRALGPVAIDGVRLDTLLVELPADEPTSSRVSRERSHQLRLVVLEGMASSRSEVLDFTARAITSAEHSAAIRLQAMRTRATVSTPAPESVRLAAPQGVLDRLGTVAGAREVARLLLAGNVDLPPRWRDPARTPEVSVFGRSVVFDFLIGTGEVEAARDHLLDLCELDRGLAASDDAVLARRELGRVLQDWGIRGQRERVVAFLEWVGEGLTRGPEQRALHGIAVRAGAAVPNRERRDVSLLLELSSGESDVVEGREDLLGALSANPSEAVASPARELLIQRLEQVITVPGHPSRIERTVEGFDRAISDLLASGADIAAAELITHVRTSLRRVPDSPTTARVYSPAWPRSRHGPLDLDRLERPID